MDGTSLRDELQRQIQAGQMQACLLSSRRGANDAMAREKAQDLHRLRQLEQKFLVPFEMMYLGGIAARELAHSLDAFPIRNRYELGFVRGISRAWPPAVDERGHQLSDTTLASPVESSLSL
jgi:hypothetical protein